MLVIAIDEYKYLATLNNAIKDVREITNILTQLYQFDEENIHTLYNQEATEDGIDNKFLELVDLIGEEDNLLIFYSGHGYYRENVKEGYWIPVDGRRDKVSDYISNANLIKYLQNIKAHHLLMIVDSCFSGALVEQLRGNTNANSESFPSRRIFASGRTEMVSDGVPGENSPFAKGIIDFLKFNTQKQVSTTALIDSVRTFVGRIADQDPIEGRLRSAKDNRGEFFFKRKLSESDFWTNALAKDTFEAYKEYLEIYPDGKYYVEAEVNLKKQMAKKAWKIAIKSNTPDDYQGFIVSYPDSEYVETARAKLKLLIKAEEERKAFLREKVQTEIEIERCITNYRRVAQEGEIAFRENDYRKAREKFWECEEHYMEGIEGFIPSLEIIVNKREQCTKKITFLAYKEEGKTAFSLRNYKAAIEYFTKALEIEVEDEECHRLKGASLRLLNAKGQLEVKTDRDDNQSMPKPGKNPSISVSVKENSIEVKPTDTPADKTQLEVRPTGSPSGGVKRSISVLPGTSPRSPQPTEYDRGTVNPNKKFEAKVTTGEGRKDLFMLKVAGLLALYLFIAYLLELL